MRELTRQSTNLPEGSESECNKYRPHCNVTLHTAQLSGKTMMVVVGVGGWGGGRKEVRRVTIRRHEGELWGKRSETETICFSLNIRKFGALHV